MGLTTNWVFERRKGGEKGKVRRVRWKGGFVSRDTMQVNHLRLRTVVWAKGEADDDLGVQ